MPDMNEEIIALLREFAAIGRGILEAQQKPAPPSPWMDTAEVSAYTAIPEGTIRDYVHKEIIPFVRPKGTRLIRFRKEDIDRWMASYQHKGRTTRRIKIDL